jgi:hypothetical protein
LNSEASSLPDMYTFDLGIKKYSDKPIEGHCMIQLTNELQECYDLKRQRHCCRFTDIEETWQLNARCGPGFKFWLTKDNEQGLNEVARIVSVCQWWLPSLDHCTVVM